MRAFIITGPPACGKSTLARLFGDGTQRVDGNNAESDYYSALVNSISGRQQRGSPGVVLIVECDLDRLDYCMEHLRQSNIGAVVVRMDPPPQIERARENESERLRPVVRSPGPSDT